MCTSKKEIKLKYELENNVNLISFKNRNIEISFNENLDNNFIKNLTYKLLDWTGERWIITLSKRVVSKTIKEVKKIIPLVKQIHQWTFTIANLLNAELNYPAPKSGEFLEDPENDDR